MPRPTTLEWTGSSLRLIDQTRLPGETVYVDLVDEKQVWDAIRRLVVRGAPAIGAAAAYGACLGARGATPDAPGNADAVRSRLLSACDHLATSRPTAVNLFWALDRMRRVQPIDPTDGAAYLQQLLDEAQAIQREDVDCCQRIGEHGLAMLQRLGVNPPIRVLTHCNAGALATCGIGTALAPIHLGRQRGVAFEVYADETRPLLQGARLTAYELAEAGVRVTVLCDGMAASLLSTGRVDAILVGADRIAANGDTANKIGTLGLAILARHFGVPFYVLAPTSTIDPSLRDGSQIPIEHRSTEEIARPFGADAYNPAFDVTPAGLIRAIITEHGATAPGDLGPTIRQLAK